MKSVRIGLVALLAVAGLTACSSSTVGKAITISSGTNAPSTAAQSSTSSAPESPTTSSTGTASGTSTGTASSYCARLSEFQSKLAKLSAGASDPSKLPALIDEEVSFFNGLKSGAPADVSKALTDMVTVLTAAKGALTDPTHADPVALQNLASKLPADSQTIAAYIAKNCTTS